MRKSLRPRFFLRVPCFSEKGPHRVYSQDWPTVIMLWKWIHIYNLTFNVWFPAGGRAARDPETMRRPGTEMRIVDWHYFKTICGKRAWLELVEDLMGVRLCPIAKRIARLFRIKLKHQGELRTDNWFLRLATLDDRQDYSEYDRHSEKPRTCFHG